MVWQDNRGPTYDVQYPIGNTRDAQGRAISAGTQIVNTFLSLWTGSGSGPAQQGLHRRPPEPVRDVQRTRPAVPRRLQLDLVG